MLSECLFSNDNYIICYYLQSVAYTIRPIFDVLSIFVNNIYRDFLKLKVFYCQPVNLVITAMPRYYFVPFVMYVAFLQRYESYTGTPDRQASNSSLYILPAVFGYR